MPSIVVKILLQTFLIQYYNIHLFAISTENDIPSGQVKPLCPKTVNPPNDPNTETSTKKQISHEETPTPLTQVLYRPWNDKKFTPVGLGKGQNFEEFVERSHLIVDKSKLLSFLFRQDDCFHLITAPRCWGKSTNLNMINFFASRQYNEDGEMIEPDKTDAYKYFKKGEIRKSTGSTVSDFKFNAAPLVSTDVDLIDDHLARYVTVRLDFAIVDINDINNTVSTNVFFETFKDAISRAYKSVGYLNRILQKKINQEKDENVKEKMQADLDKYWTFRSKEEDSPTELSKSMVTLFEIISKYVNQDENGTNRLLFLFDEYEKPLNDLYLSRKLDVECDEAIEISSFLTDFFLYTFKGSIPYRAVVTGITRITGEGVFTTMNKFADRGIGSIDSLYPYYGFTEKEVMELLEAKGLKPRFDEVKNFYKGYHKISSPHKWMFNPWDVMNNLVSGYLSDYWCETGNAMLFILPDLLKYYQVRRIITALLDGESYFALSPTNTKFSIEIYKNVDRILRKCVSRCLSEVEVEQIMGYFLNSGYVTVVGLDQKDNKWHVGLPNMEVIMYVQNVVVYYINSLYDDGREESFEAAQSLKAFLDRDDEQSIKLFENNFSGIIKSRNITKDFLKELNSTDPKPWTQFGFAHLTEASLHCVFYKILSFLQTAREINLGSEVTFTFKNPKNELVLRRPDIFAYNENRALIGEMKCECSVPIDEVLDQALEYTSILYNRTKRFDVIKYMAINLCVRKGKNNTEISEIRFKTTKKTRDEIDSLMQTRLNKATTTKKIVKITEPTARLEDKKIDSTVKSRYNEPMAMGNDDRVASSLYETTTLQLPLFIGQKIPGRQRSHPYSMDQLQHCLERVFIGAEPITKVVRESNVPLPVLMKYRDEVRDHLYGKGKKVHSDSKFISDHRIKNEAVREAIEIVMNKCT